MATADERRRQILALLQQRGPLTAAEIGEHFGLTAEWAGQHIRAMRRTHDVVRAGGSPRKGYTWRAAEKRDAGELSGGGADVGSRERAVLADIRAALQEAGYSHDAEGHASEPPSAAETASIVRQLIERVAQLDEAEAELCDAKRDIQGWREFAADLVRDDGLLLPDDTDPELQYLIRQRIVRAEGGACDEDGEGGDDSPHDPDAVYRELLDERLEDVRELARIHMRSFGEASRELSRVRLDVLAALAVVQMLEIEAQRASRRRGHDDES